MTPENIDRIAKKFGTPFYAFYVDEFISNYKELKDAYTEIYDNFEIAYSYKTNYMPACCKEVLKMGGYSEVVSDMEYHMAKRYGFEPSKIIVNGPGKWNGIEEMASDGAVIMVDNKYELDRVIAAAAELDKEVTIGFRLNIDIGTKKNSRFGFDVLSPETNIAIDHARESKNIRIIGLHFHLGGSRSIEAWKARAEKMTMYADTLLRDDERKIIDLGSGMFGHVAAPLAAQFGQDIPNFSQYAEVVAGVFREKYGDLPESSRPLLIVEPGSTIIANTMMYAVSVIGIKTVRGRNIAMTDGSVHQMGEMGKKKQLPAHVIKKGKDPVSVMSADITGYTCLEDDIMYRSLPEEVSFGDIIYFENCGAYTNVMKPPFIQTGCKIVSCRYDGTLTLVKRGDTVDDYLAGYEEEI